MSRDEQYESDGQRQSQSRASAERSELTLLFRDVLVTVGVVVVAGLVLVGVSGVWPPLVAVESGSMEPNVQKGDVVVVSEPGRFAPDGGHSEHGVVSAAAGQEMGYRSFGDYGSVVVYAPPERSGSPIIHRAAFWVEEGEDWTAKADPVHLPTEDCADLRNCPAPNAGYVTKGDANEWYDQAAGLSPPVRPAWVRGTAHVRVPYVGWLRLLLSTTTDFEPVVPAPPGVATPPACRL